MRSLIHIHKKRFGVLIVGMLLLLVLGMAVRSITASGSDDPLVMIVVDKDLYEGGEYTEYIDTYANDIRTPINDYYGGEEVEIWEVDRSTYDLDRVNPMRLTYAEEQKLVRDLSLLIEEKYRENNLKGVVFIGRVPIPQINKDGKLIPSMYPYIDFDDPGYVWSTDDAAYVPTNNTRPTAEIWFGYIAEVNEESILQEDVTLADYFEANHAYYEGDYQVNQRILFNDFIREDKLVKGLFPDGWPENWPDDGDDETEDKDVYDKTEQTLETYYASLSDYARWTGRYDGPVNKTYQEWDEDAGVPVMTDLEEHPLTDVDASLEVIRYLDTWAESKRAVVDRTGNLIHEIANGLFGLDPTGYGGTPPYTTGEGGSDGGQAGDINSYFSRLMQDTGISTGDFDYFVGQPDGTFLRRNILNRDEFEICFNNASEYDTDVWNDQNSAEAMYELSDWLYHQSLNTVIVYALDGPGTVKLNGVKQNKWFFEAEAGNTLEPDTTLLDYYYVDECDSGNANHYDKRSYEGFDPLDPDNGIDDEYYYDVNKNGIFDAADSVVYEGWCADGTNTPGTTLATSDAYPSNHRIQVVSGSSSDIKLLYVANGKIVETTLNPGSEYTIPALESWETSQLEPFSEEPESWEEFQTAVTWLNYLTDAEKKAYIFKEHIPPVGKYADLDSTYEIVYSIAQGSDNRLVFKTLQPEEDTGGEGDGGDTEESVPPTDAYLVGACLQDRMWHDKSLYSVILGGGVGVVPNAGPIGTMGLWDIASGKTLGTTAQMQNKFTIELRRPGSVDPGEEIPEPDPNDNSENANAKIVVPGLTEDLAADLKTANESGNPQLFKKLLSGLNGGGLPFIGTDDALDVQGVGFEFSGFILNFTSGMPIGEALKPYYDETEIYFGDPLLVLPPANDEE